MDVVNPPDWARQQLTDAGYPQQIKTAIERLLEVWWTQNHTHQTRQLTLEAFDKLAQGQALIPEVEGDEVWEPVKPGSIYVRDTIRVRFDAYNDELTGRNHNGRRGVVVAIRSGDVIVNYTDGRMPEGKGVHHSPHSLEKLVK